MSRWIETTGAGMGRVLGLVADWHERAAQRRDLMAFDDRLLRDIGVSRTELVHETSRKFSRG